MSSKSTIILQRRRGEALEKALLDATWEELRTVGYHKLTFDNVALRAGTSKAVLYRRWSNRLELVRAALRSHRPLLSGNVPNTGSLRSDVLLLLKRMSKGLSELHPDIVWGILTDAINDQPQHDFLQSQIRQSNTIVMTTILQQAEARGDLVLTDIPQRLVTLPLDLTRHEMFLTGQPATNAVITQIVDDIFLPLLRQ